MDKTPEENKGLSMKLITVKRDGIEYLRLDVKGYNGSWKTTVRDKKVNDE